MASTAARRRRLLGGERRGERRVRCAAPGDVGGARTVGRPLGFSGGASVAVVIHSVLSSRQWWVGVIGGVLVDGDWCWMNKLSALVQHFRMSCIYYISSILLYYTMVYAVNDDTCRLYHDFISLYTLNLSICKVDHGLEARLWDVQLLLISLIAATALGVRNFVVGRLAQVVCSFEQRLRGPKWKIFAYFRINRGQNQA